MMVGIRRDPTPDEEQAYGIQKVLVIMDRTGVWDEMNRGEKTSFVNLLKRRMPPGFDDPKEPIRPGRRP